MLILRLSDDKVKDSVYLLPLCLISPRCQIWSATYSDGHTQLNFFTDYIIYYPFPLSNTITRIIE